MLGVNIPCPRFLHCLALAFAEEGLHGLLQEIPYAGFVVKICASAYGKYHDEQQDEDIARALPKALEDIVRTKPAVYQQQCEQIAEEVLPHQPAKVRKRLAGSLMLVQGQIKKSFTRKEDMTGKTRPPAFVVRGPQDLEAIIPPRAPQFQEGDLLPNDPQWVLVQRLDSGGFGEVWKVQHAAAGNLFKVVKFCLDATAQDRLLKHEARVINQVMQIKNDHIVKLEGLNLSLPSPWLRYEFIDGGNLLTSMRMPEDMERRAAWTRNIMLPLARTVGACHLLNPAVVHRDLKPANILIELVDGHDGKKRPRIKITDFGISEIIAQQALDQAHRETPQRGSFSTPTILQGSYTAMYASEQQKAGLPSAPTDDVYALGVMWFQFLMGDCFLPLGRDYRDDLIDLKLCDELIAVVAKCVADRADRRWPNARVLADEIDKLPANWLKTAAETVEKITPKPIVEEKKPPPTISESPANRVRRLKAEAAKLHEDTRALLELHDYDAAADLLEGFRPELMPLRDAALFSEIVSNRDRLRQLHQEIHQRLDSGKLQDARLPGLIAGFLEIKPNDAEMLDLAREFPAPKRGQLITSALGMKFAWVPPGASWLGGGGGKPGTTPFTLEQGLWCGIYPVTQAEWQQVMGTDPSNFKGNPRFPVETVSWNDVQKFLEKLNARGGNYAYRLPTEQEWEYICRGGPIIQDQSKYDFYFAKSRTDLTPNPTNDLTNKANFGNQLSKPSDVGSYMPNPLEIYDLHGNVWEWTSSSEGSGRVIRGSSWRTSAEGCTASFRFRTGPVSADYDLGFRLLAVPQDR